MRKLFQIVVILIALNPTSIIAQSVSFSVSGKVTDEATGAPLPSASVFISHSTRGGLVSPDGSFVINGLTEGKYNLIVSYVGFETRVYPFVINQKNVVISIALKPVAKKLEDVVIRTNNDVWNKRFETFRQAFIGTDHIAKHTHIENKEALRLQKDTITNNLTAKSKDLLIITNTDLGYRISYLLQDFIYNKQSGYLHYFGYPVFRELEPRNKSQERKWKKARRKIYESSLLRFYRVLGQRSLSEQGYVTGQLIREKKSLTEILSKDEEKHSEYFNMTLNNTKYHNNIFTDVPYESLITPVNNGKYIINFEGILSVDATYATGDPENLSTYKRGGKFSVITLNKPVLIHNNGLPDNPLDIIYYGYWMNMRIANLLPFDYEPEEE